MTGVWECLACGLRDIAHAYERCPSCWKDKPIMPKISATSGPTNADDPASMIADEPAPVEEAAPAETVTDAPAAPEAAESAPEAPVAETIEPAAPVAPEPAPAPVSDAPAAPVDAPKDAPTDAPADPQPAVDLAPAVSLFTPAVPARAPGLAGDLLGDTPPPQSKSGSKSV